MRRVAPLLAALAFAAPARAQPDLVSYAVRPGYALSVDSSGFLLPTSIAFVPNPGERPDDPLYFVAELRGTIKVVTRDRQVRRFAEVPSDRAQDSALYGDSQGGLGGICLDPEHGYVFATFTALGERGVLRNRLVRFSTRPGTFATEPGEARRLDAMLAPFQSAPAHQIGNCVVEEGRLFVGVGDGGNATNSANPEILTGKILCLDLDGAPCRDNPAMRAGAADASSSVAEAPPPEAFVYASGLRNPFGLARVDGALYAVDNGIDLDRFLRIEPGQDHLWRGTDQSLAARAGVVFTPSVGPVQMAHLPPGSPLVEEGWRERFVAAVFGGPQTNAGLIGFGGLPPGAPPVVPQYLLEHVGAHGTQRFAALAQGPDGLYTAPMVPGPDGTSPVLRLSYRPAEAHPVTIQPRAGLQTLAGFAALAEHGCISCHAIAGKGGGIGPTLDYFALEWRLTGRLNSAQYAAQVASVDALEDETFARWREARQDVLAAEGVERTWRWLRYFLQEPRFDNPATQMPDLDISAAEAERLRSELSAVTGFRGEAPGGNRWLAALRRNLRPLLVGAAAGGAAVTLAAIALFLVIRRRPRRAGGEAPPDPAR